MKNKLLIPLVLVLCSSLLQVLQAQEPSIPQMSLPENLLATLKTEHPRLHATTADFAALKKRITNDETLKVWYDELLKEGESILGESAGIYTTPGRSLSTSRRVVVRTYTLGLLYQLSGDKKYAEREWKELESASKFPDWDPKHFLDVGEMTHAFAIGYDWFFSYWNTNQKNIIKSAIIEKGLCRALLAYEGKTNQESMRWTDCPINWNLVCNGGIGLGALSIADEEPKLSEYILRQVIKNLPYAMINYGPDGAWHEGPVYWKYATLYNVSILSGLFSALGTDFGLSNIEGFSKTGLFPIYITGSINRSFNYADANDAAVSGSQMYWLASKFNLPAAALYQKKMTTASGGLDIRALDILWYPVDLIREKTPDMPLAVYYRSAEVTTLRSAWNDKNAWFVGFMAGDNKAGHSHLDIGSFVLDAMGKRWALDFGTEKYNVPEYFNREKGTRWTYYRTRAEGHNAIVLNPSLKPDQDPQASARITKFSTQGKTSFAIADLTPAYSSEATKVERGIALVDGQAIVIQDEIKAKSPAQLYWFLHTKAQINIAGNGQKAIMTLDSAHIEVEIISPAKAKFTVMSAVPLASSPKSDVQNKNEGVRKLAISLNGVTNERIIVEIHPVKLKVSGSKMFYKPLNEW